MSLSFLFFTVPVLVQAVAAIALAAIAATRQRHPPAKAFAALMVAIAIWSLANIFEKMATNFELKVAWSNVQYIGIAIVPVAWFALGIAFTGRARWINRWTLLLLSFFPVLLLIVLWTDQWHGWARTSSEIAVINESFSVLKVTYGPVLKLFIVYCYALMLLGFLLMFEAAVRGERIYRSQAAIMFASALGPWLVNWLFINRVPVFDQLDLTPLSFAPAAIAVGWCVFQYRLLDLIPVARDAVVEAIVDGVVVLDDRQRIIDMNPAACRILHAEPGSMIGSNLEDVLAGQIETLRELTANPSLRREITIDDQAGPRTYEMSVSSIVDSVRRTIGQVAILRDVTERMAAEASDQASQARYQSVLEQASDGIFIFDKDRILRAANPRGLEMFGYTEAEVLGRGMEEFTLPEDLTLRSLDLTPLLQGKRLLRERRFRHKEGHLIPVEVSATMMADGYFLAIVRDITERKKAEEEQKRLESQIQHAQKLESLGVLAGGIAHDFNNLLVGMLANAGLALIDLPEDSTSRRCIEQLESAARRASSLCRQMLAYSGRGTFEVQSIDLQALVREIIGFLSASISKKVTIVCDAPKTTCGIEGDFAQIQQLVLNLITNAAEAIGTETGTVTIRLRRIAVDPSMLTTFGSSDLPAGEYIAFDVHDDGCGMSEETKAKIFDPFFSTKFAGRGLGLAAVLGIVRRHQGVINVQSEPGVGTTVSILLPAADLAPAEEPAPAAAPATREGTGMILVVDDEQSVRTVAKRILTRFGYEVLLARDGKEAIAIFNENIGRVDAVLLDLTMPEMNGEETFAAIRKISPTMKVILSSGYNETEVSDHFNGHSPTDFLQKPYGPLELVDKVRDVLGTPVANAPSS